MNSTNLTMAAAGMLIKQQEDIARLSDEIARLRHIMSAAASMAGKDWLYVQLALAEALSGGGSNLDWMLEAYKEVEKGE